MTAMSVIRRFAVCVLALTGAAILHFIFGRILAAGDPVQPLITRPDAGTLAAAAGLALSRSFLLFVAPGWVLTLIVSAVMDAVLHIRHR
jgi:hypothetical protein